ncbi:MAG: GGDEF domain-containing protein [Clostridia bacterium]|nr:GGDEF domain-containing protein [Clostridia bacterium]
MRDLQSRLLTTHKIEQYHEEIRDRNCDNFQMFAVGGIIITGIILAVGATLIRYTVFVREYLLFFIYLIVLYFVARFCNKKKVKHIIYIYYAALLPIYGGGILMGTFFDPDQPAITIMALMCGLTLFIIDKPRRMFLYALFIAVSFAVCSYIAKEQKIFITDMVNLLIYFCLSVAINYFSLRDRVESVENYVKLREKSERDTMTSLLNRGAGETQAKGMLAAGINGAFAIMDVDDFKQINDTYGHQVGDEVICQATRKLQETFRTTDIVWRLGGDEFAVYAVGLVDKEICEKKFEQLKNDLRHVQTSNPKCNSITISVGCTICQKANMNFEDLYRYSDEALYEVKKNSKGGYLCRSLTE